MTSIAKLKKRYLRRFWFSQPNAYDRYPRRHGLAYDDIRARTGIRWPKGETGKRALQSVVNDDMRHFHKECKLRQRITDKANNRIVRLCRKHAPQDHVRMSFRESRRAVFQQDGKL